MMPILASATAPGAVGVIIGALGNLGPIWVRTYYEMFDQVVAVVQPSELEQARVALSEFSRIKIETADVTMRGQVESLARRLHDSGLSVSALLINAGIDIPPNAGEQLDLTRSVVEVNLVGASTILTTFADLIVDGGAVVLIGSMYADLAPRPSNYSHLPGFVKQPIYGATKAACLNLAKQYAGLWGAREIRVNMLSPGGIYSGQDIEFVESFSRHVPMGRMGRADELAGALRFLSGDDSTYVTGINLAVNGGVHVW